MWQRTSLRNLVTRAGAPTSTEFGGASLVTTEPPAMMHPAPTRTRGKISALAPTITPFSKKDPHVLSGKVDASCQQCTP